MPALQPKREEAEEVLQEALLLVFSKINQFRFDGPFEGWLRRIMVNQALERYRSKTHSHASTSINPQYNEPWTQEVVHSELSAKELLSMVQKLPKAYRLVFNLYVFEGLKHREIATLLGIAEGISKSNLFDARELLAKAVVASEGNQKIVSGVDCKRGQLYTNYGKYNLPKCELLHIEFVKPRRSENKHL